VLGLVSAALTEKSFTVAEKPMGAVVPPGKLRLAVLPTELVPCSTVVGAVTVTVTFAAKLTLWVTPQLLAVANVVRVELFTVPKVQLNVPLVTAGPQVPWLVLALVDELTSSLSVNTTPETGSPVL
jgi:hypothetical protein